MLVDHWKSLKTRRLRDGRSGFSLFAFGSIPSPAPQTSRLLRLLLGLAVFLLLPVAVARAVPGGPKTFNLYLSNSYLPADTVLFARYSALGLDVDTSDQVLLRLKQLNPAIKLLAYIPINGTYFNANIFLPTSKWRAMWEAADINGWWLRNTQGGIIYDHPGKYTFNLTSNCPANGQGQRMWDWYPQFIVQTVLRNGAAPWDGVILDDVWKGIWFVGQNTQLNLYPIDSNRDGLADDQPSLDALWAAANDSIVSRIRRLMPPGKVLGGNGQNSFYQMNGSFIESFPYNGAQDPGSPVPGYCWNDKMFGYLGYYANEDLFSRTPYQINVLNAKWTQGDKYTPVRTPEYERHKRFCLASTLLRDGYFSLDWMQVVTGHNSVWWEPEYDKAIGTPLGPAFQATYAGKTLWRRNYSNGVVLVNPNYTLFGGSPADSLPPIGWVDGAILLRSELWRPESIPPAAVSDLGITRSWTNQIEVQWTNVGDDGSTGHAVEVQVRYSTAPITAANWSSAAIGATGIVPQRPGISQKQIITGLTNNTLYYFGVKSRDLAGNWAALSNVPSATTVVGDITPPAAITNLTVLSTTATTALVRWSAPGDDGSTGTAAQFDLRYHTVPLDAVGWGGAAQVVGEPTPGPNGTVHTLTLYGMRAGTLYYFGIKTGDEMPNWSPLSNIPSATTQPGDVAPPATASDLRVASVGSNWLTLAWTAPGDDGTSGLATSYDLRLSPNPMTSGSYFTATFVTGEPGPQLPGATQFQRLSGLGVGYNYYLGLRTGDEIPNWSGVSNIVTTRTGVTAAADVTPPGTVTGLIAAPGGPGSVTLTWTAPGDDGFSGTAYAYEIRQAASAAIVSGFTAATPLFGEPMPGAAGGTVAMTVTGLTDGVTYFFGLKTADEQGNWSNLSNVASAQAGTPPTIDTTPPAAVDNLAVVEHNWKSVRLSWLSPGDDAWGGTATAFDIRYATTRLTEENFASASIASGPPAPGQAGTRHGITIDGLLPTTLYFFALKTRDEAGNWSPVSSVAQQTTPMVPTDQIAPSRVTNLKVVGGTPSGVILAWSAPGGDAGVGQATAYDLRYSEHPLTFDNWFGASQAEGLPVPQPAATLTQAEVRGLSPLKTYYFALRSRDKVPNWSEMSNGASGTTLQILSTAPALLPLTPDLAAPWPNPSAGVTHVALSLPAGGDEVVVLTLFDVHGRVVRRLFEGSLPAGAHGFEWDGRDDAGLPAPSGLYFVEMRAGTDRRTRKILLRR